VLYSHSVSFVTFDGVMESSLLESRCIFNALGYSDAGAARRAALSSCNREKKSGEECQGHIPGLLLADLPNVCTLDGLSTPCTIMACR